MPDDVAIRPLTAHDLPAATETSWAAIQVHIPPQHMPSDDEQRRQRGQARLEHLLATDPQGAWVADRDGEIVGVSLALLREGVWGLSLLAVAPELQGRGIGARLFAPALSYGDDARGGIILSSVDARAMRSYARAGFGLRPCVAAAGTVDRTAIPAGLRARAGDPINDRETCDLASRHVRGAAHGSDVAKAVEGGSCLLVIDGRGFAMHRDGIVALLAATDENTARDLLWSCFADAPAGASLEVDFIASGQDWAVDVSLRAGLALSPDGPLFVRGDVGPMAPYLPSGTYL